MEWTTRINWADLLVIILLIRGIYVGSHRGLFGELFYIFGLYLSIVLSLHFYPYVSGFLSLYMYINPNIANFISFIIISLIMYLLFITLYNFLHKLVKVEVFPPINKLGGPLFGLCEGFILSTLLFLIMLITPIGYITESAKTKSLLGPLFIRTGTALYEKSLSYFGTRDLAEFLKGAEPLEFEILKPKKRKRLDEMLE